MDVVLVVGAAVGGGLVVVGAIVGVVLLRRRSKPVDEFEVLGEEDPAKMFEDHAAPAVAVPVAPAAPEEHPFSVAKEAPWRPAAQPKTRPTMLPPLPENEGGVATEWARRHVGPLESDRVRGICSGCGTTISVSKRRPIRVACPVCGRTRLLG